GGAAELLDRLVAARLVVVDRGEAQLCHDSLLYGWRRLRDWINEDRVGLLLRRRLGEAADGWDEAGRRASGLYSGDQLASARALLAQDGRVPATRLVEREFLHASSRRERLTKRVLVVGVSLMVTLAVVASTLAVLARGSQRDAEAREATLIADQLAAQADSMREEDPQTALRLSLAAYRTADTPQTRSSLYGAYVSRTPAVLQGSRKAVLNVAFSSDGDVLATSQTKGGVQLWDVSRANTPDKAKHIEPGGISAAIAFHPRSRLLAAQTEQALTLWDVADPAKPRRLAERGLPEGQTYSLAFSPDGRVLAAGGEGGRLRLWDVSEPSAPRLRTDRVVARTALISLTFSREGQSLVTGNGISKGRSAEVRLWDVRNPARPVVRDTATARTVMAVAFHPKRDLVVATGAEGEIAWWTVEQGALVPVEAQDEFGNRWGDTGIPSLSFRPDGELLAGARGDAGAGLRTAAESGSELTDGSAEKGTLAGGEPVQSVAYSPDGTHLAVGEVGGAVLLWPEHAPAPAVTGELSPEDRGAGPVSPDGRFVVTTSLLDSGTVWDLRPVDTTKGTGPRQRQRLISPWEPRFFLPGRDRPVLLAQRWPGPAQNHVFRLWDVGGDGPPTHGADIPFVSENTRVAVSGDGRLLVIGSWKSPRTEVWDIRDVRRPVRRAVIDVPPSAEPGTLWFLDSRALATVQNAQRGDLMIWDLTDPGRPRQVELLKGVARGRGGYVRSAKLLITDYTAERAQLWDMTGFPRKPRKAGTLPAASGGYHPVGKGELATMLKDGTVQFWDVSDPYKPSSKPKRSIRFDREIKSVELAPDGKQVVTKDPYRVWDIGQDGRWLTPAVATLEGVKQLTLLSANSPFMAVQPDYSRNSGPATTYLLDRDTDKIYDRLCRTHPLSVGTEQWDALFPHLGHRPSCG
ncbi:MAG TPA: WD40 repeat domain-containing protein, partial [Streptomyces sp.]|nr:WD40 repeat domain-containing protein [Streptomyces sp.]